MEGTLGMEGAVLAAGSLRFCGGGHAVHCAAFMTLQAVAK